MQYLVSFHLPQNWREDVVARLYPAEDRAAMEREEQAIRARMERLVELYLAGDVDRVHYEREKRASYDRLADLRPAGYSDIMEAGGTLERFEHLWSASSALEQKKLLRFAVAAVLIRGKLIRAVKLTESFYPFVPYRNGRKCGSDGRRAIVK